MAVYACVTVLRLFLCCSLQTTMQRGHIRHVQETVTYYGQFLEFHLRILSCLTYSVWNISGSNRQLKLNESKFLQGSQVEHKVSSELLLLLKRPFTVWLRLSVSFPSNLLTWYSQQTTNTTQGKHILFVFLHLERNILNLFLLRSLALFLLHP